LFTSGDGVSMQIQAADLKTGRSKTLIRGSDAVYVDPGYLVFVAAPSETMTADRFRPGSLLAVRFDAKRLEVLGDPVEVSDDLLTLITGAGEYGVSATGTLVYVPADIESQDQRTRSLVWVNRKGQEEALRAPERVFATARISPDASRIVVDIRDQGQDIWIWDLKRETLTPLNRDPNVDMSPVWTPDGRRIVWTSARVAGTPNLYWQLADGTGAVERLTTTPGNQFPTSITPDGSRALVFGSAGPTGMDIFTVALNEPNRKQVPLLQLPSQDFGPEVSPDGRWLAYHSTESGQSQVFVRPFPNVDGGRWPISTTGGSRAAWARNGRELFYLDNTGVLMSVAVQAKGEAFTASAPAKVLNTPYYAGSTTLGLPLRAYDVSPDGQRFLMIKEVGSAGDRPSRPLSRMVVVQNWFEELKARTAAR
jgi:serine/threonine-protein kinase